MVQETLRKLVQDEVEPVALENDEHRRFARAGFDQLAELGMLGLPIAEASGGAGRQFNTVGHWGPKSEACRWIRLLECRWKWDGCVEGFGQRRI